MWIKDYCNQKHSLTDATCIRPKGHAGDCYTRWDRKYLSPKTLIRAEYENPKGKNNTPATHLRYVERVISETFGGKPI